MQFFLSAKVDKQGSLNAIYIMVCFLGKVEVFLYSYENVYIVTKIIIIFLKYLHECIKKVIDRLMCAKYNKAMF